jgi:predicted GNAT family acetyltransferase
MQHRATHFPNKQRFELKAGPGDPAVLTYHIKGGITVMDHTFVPAHLRGKGIAAILTRDALLEARRLGWKIIPDCSYVETYILRNPEFENLLDS